MTSSYFRLADAAQWSVPHAGLVRVRGREAVPGPGGKPPQEDLCGLQDPRAHRPRPGNTGLWLVKTCHVTWTLASDWPLVVVITLILTSQYLTVYFTFWQAKITQVDTILGLILLIVQFLQVILASHWSILLILASHWSILWTLASHWSILQMSCAAISCLPNRHRICWNPFETDWDKLEWWTHIHCVPSHNNHQRISYVFNHKIVSLKIRFLFLSLYFSLFNNALVCKKIEHLKYWVK